MSLGKQFLSNGSDPLMSVTQGWGEVSRDIHLPFGTCRFLQLTPAQHRGLDTLDVNTSPLGDAHVEIDVRSTDPDVFRDIDWQGREYELEFDYAPERVRWAGDGFLVELDTGSKTCSCRLWTRINDAGQFSGVAQNLLRVIAAYRLLDIGGVLLHSAGIAARGGTTVFFGTSGAGKSTVAAAALEHGCEVFSDDLNAVVPSTDGYVVAAVPFTGDLGRSTASRSQLPLTALYRLRQSDQNATSELPASEAVALLATCSPFVNVDPHRQARVLDVLATLVTMVPPRILFFRKPVDFWGGVIT